MTILEWPLKTGVHDYDGLDFQCFNVYDVPPLLPTTKKRVKKHLYNGKKGIIFGVDPFNARVAIYVILFVCMISPGPVVKILKVSMNKSLAQ